MKKPVQPTVFSVHSEGLTDLGESPLKNSKQNDLMSNDQGKERPETNRMSFKQNRYDPHEPHSA